MSSSDIGATPPADETTPGGASRGQVIGHDLHNTATWTLRLIILLAGLWLLQEVLGRIWVAVLPVLLAVVLSTVLRPPVRFMTSRGVPSAVAALITMVLSLAALGLVFTAIVRSIAGQAPDLASQATQGLREVQDWIAGPPLNLGNEQISSAVDAVTSRLQSSAGAIADGAITGASAAGSALITLVLMLVLTFFFIKDAEKFLPWVRRITGRKSGRHLSEVMMRVWTALSGFVRTQAIVAAVDAVLIGIGLLILGVPLVAALAALTFLGAFIPIVGAFVAGALAVLVALVANGPVTALIVLGLIVVVQQIEGNVLQPALQGQSLDLHPIVVIAAVTLGSSLGGIVGAFFAVPAAASLAVVLRYMSEQVDRRADDVETGESVHGGDSDEGGDGDGEPGTAPPAGSAAAGGTSGATAADVSPEKSSPSGEGR